MRAGYSVRRRGAPGAALVCSGRCQLMYYGNPKTCYLGAILAFNRTGAIDRALDVVKTALEGGNIKLLGSGFRNDLNEQNAKADADYLNTLITSVVNNLETLTNGGD